MSWGIKITILYLGFVSLILSMVAMAMQENVDLVSKDYYEQELKYQDRIDKINRSNALEEPLTWELKENELRLKFPEQFKGKSLQCNIHFFRPSDAALDKTISLPTDTSIIRVIPTRNLESGLYKMQISWEVNKEEYYNEGIIKVN